MGIPNMSLPELRPVQTENPMDQYAKALQIRQMGQQNQQMALQTEQQRQALKDQQAMTQAMHDWDGKDINALVPLTVKYGASANAVMGLKSKVLEQQEKYSTIAKNDADTGAKNIETMKQKNDLLVGKLNTVIDPSVPDDELLPRFQAAVSDAVQSGLLDQQHGQTALQQVGQAKTPQAFRAALKLYEKSFIADTQQLEDAKKAADTHAAGFKGEGGVMYDITGAKPQAVAGNPSVAQQELSSWLNTKEQNGKTRAENGKTAVDYQQAADTKTESTSSDLFGTNTVHHTAPSLAPPIGSSPSAQPKTAIVPPAKGNGKVLGAGAPTPVDVDPNGRNDAALQGLKPSDAAAIKAIADYRLNPQQFMRRPGVLAKVAEYDPSFDQQRYQLKQKTRQYFITGKGAEEVAAFNTAQQHADLLQKSFDALNNGDMPSINAIKNSFASAFGSGAPVSTRAIIDAYNHEVNTAIAKGHTTDHEIADRKLTLSPNASPEQVKDVLNGYKSLMQSKIRIRMNQYESGLRGEPAFGQSAPGQGGKISVTAPDGSVHPFESQAQADAFKKLAGIK